jgi:hypothetical protein
LKNDDFFDEASKIEYNQLPKTNSSVRSRVMLNIERFEIGNRYVTAKVENRYGNDVTINIQGSRPGIESLFKIKEQERRLGGFLGGGGGSQQGSGIGDMLGL